MENERTENIFYLDLKHVHKYGCTKFQPNPLFSSQQTATESAAEEKKQKKTKQKKVGKPIGDPVGGRDAPIKKVAFAVLIIYTVKSWNADHPESRPHLNEGRTPVFVSELTPLQN